MNAITGVLPMKNSCYTIPPGSNADGIKPKSQPTLTNAPSIKNAVGSAQKLRGYIYLNLIIFYAQCALYSSFKSAGPPTNIYT